MPNARFEQALQQGAAGQRLSPEAALELVAEVTPDALHAIGAAAHQSRVRRFGLAATFVCNLQVNPSNVCRNRCRFCAYSVASVQDKRAYCLTEDEILAQVRATNPSEVHMVGGLNELWPFERCRDLVRALRQAHPSLFIKAFGAVEIAHFATTSGLTTRQVLEALIVAGVDALPGGGAEVFSERLRKEWWPNKIGPAEWLAIHEQAHELGLPTNATMLFGIGETWPERVEHLLALRASQDRRPGYVCFIPLAFQPGEGQFVQRGPTPLDSLLVLALSRLVLDNVDHIKSYWPTVGIEVAGTGLGYGADDMDGTLTRERIMHAAGASTPTGMIRRRMSALIALAGFAAVERDGRFVPLSPPATGEPAAGSTVTGDAGVGTHSRRDPVEAPK